jgi:hypothetical protein
MANDRSAANTTDARRVAQFVAHCERLSLHPKPRLLAPSSNHLLNARRPECALARDPESGAERLAMPCPETEVAVNRLRGPRTKVHRALASPLPHHTNDVLVEVEVVL